ncbi:YhgE/Pip domain-containing protein [Weissella confusa]|uniref:YhgE/Pip domain-containing protein n=1 Tax=Weissella fermenti TaxID=2987699 RepID=A0ABT6D298_9LACO|nr:MULTISPECIES: YhgE/Pip domain-containing protein [Weissella]MBJ7688826.1 YhgE/Pip domain-containing protein [Weissella confusa]MCW0927182.1 YhgE/Pip domain-containing protein [Weissella sp. LMG 11983]MDF9299624.1 YhgE/Pip domain-containing protein [Weissella sp. BK2]
MLFDKMSSKTRYMTIAGLAVVVPAVIAFGLFQLLDATQAGGPSSLKVAVVNVDQPVKHNGAKLAVGQQVVDKLRHNDSVAWEFMSAQQAKRALADGDTLMTVTLPKDFSANTLTALSAQPKASNIKYEVSKHTNYIGGILADTVTEQLKSQVTAEIQKTYNKELLGSIKQLSDGTAKAAAGTKQLNDGMGQLASGFGEVNRNLHMLASGLGEIQTGANALPAGVAQLQGGSNQLATGAETLSNGINQASAGIAQLNDGGNQLRSGVGALPTATQQLAGGSNQVSMGLNQLASNTPALVAGAKAANDGVVALGDGAKSLTAGATKVASGNQQLAAGAQQLSTQLSAGLTAIKQGQATNAADLQKLTAGLNQLNSGLGQIAEETKGLSLGDAGKTDIATNMANLKTDLTTVGAGAESFKALMADPQFQTFLSDSRNAEFKGKYMTALQQVGAVTDAGVQAQQIGDALTPLVPLLPKLSALLPALQQMGTNGQLATSGALQAIDKFSTQVGQIATQLDGAVAVANKLATSAQQLSAGAMQVQTGLVTLSGGQQQLAAKMPSLYTGLGQANVAVAQLVTGAGRVATGNQQLVNQTPTLVSGVSQLSDGLNKLQANTPALSNGAQQLAGGAGQLSDGVNMLAGKVPTLLEALNTAGAGAQQLATGDDQLNDGVKTATTGTKTLNDALQVGVKQLQPIHLGEKTINHFVSPVASKQVDRQLTVADYKAVFGPALLAFALFIGALLIQMNERRRRMTADVSAIAGLRTLFILPVLQAILMTGVIAIFKIDANLFATFLFTFIVATVFMLVTLLLDVLFGTVGLLISVIVAMAQIVLSGQIVPSEFLNATLATIAKFLPTTYAAQGYDALINHTPYMSVWAATITLVVFGIIGGVVAVLGMKRSFPVMMQPQPEVE